MKSNIKALKYGGSGMYVILVYDIVMDGEGARVQRNVFKTCKKYLHHIQMSVFEGELTKAQIMKLRNELSQYIRKDKDALIVFKSREKRWLDKEFWGKVEDLTDNFL